MALPNISDYFIPESHQEAVDLLKRFGDNALIVALPDGEYTVWVIASDAHWAPPLFEVWTGGEKKLDVRIPRARFVFMEPLKARASSGQLRIELKGPHGWILSGLVIGKEGRELAEVVARLERDIFFLTDEELPKWQEAKPTAVNPPRKRSPEEQERIKNMSREERREFWREYRRQNQ